MFVKTGRVTCNLPVPSNSLGARLTGDVGGEVLEGQDVAGVHHELHLHTDRILASAGGRLVVEGRGCRVRQARAGAG